jgi:hypothetical protein
MRLRLKVALTVLSVVVTLSLLVWQRRRFPRPAEKALEGLRTWWLGVARVIGHAQTVLILTVVYYTAVAATALIARCARRDFLRLNSPAAWHPRKRAADTLETLKRQF